MQNFQTDTRRAGQYEKVTPDAPFPVSYHFADFVKGRYATTAAHWHEHPELLCVRQGLLRIYIQGTQIAARPGDIIVINSGEIHAIPEKSDDTIYDCLIPQKYLCDRMGLPVEDVVIENLIRNEEYTAFFQKIMTELKDRPVFYEISVPINLLALMVNLCRKYRKNNTETDNYKHPSKRFMIKKAIEYIQKNYANPISTKNVCEYLGFDKSYICNNFKEITGTTIIDYLNMVRCEHAQKLLLKGTAGVTECAEQCGFHHMSYFTKTYKHYIGELPSTTAKKAKT